jgi:hypothetical protein
MEKSLVTQSRTGGGTEVTELFFCPDPVASSRP